MIYRILALFVIALAANSILRRLLSRSWGAPESTSRPGPLRPRRRGQAEPAEFEIIEDERSS
ncbi:MAG: hypothetical protein R3E97_05140 [Candidatus Eisenbacteria bacterium]